MKKELDEQLCSEFPLLYADRHADMRSTCLCWGFSCDDGWYSIIYDLSAKLEKIITDLPDTGYCECGDKKECHVDGWMSCEAIVENTKWQKPGQVCRCVCQSYRPNKVKASQVKEKFGVLRFYMTGYNDEIEQAIEQAKELSATTCEKCGNPGQLRDTGWLFTLCDECFEKRQQERNLIINQPLVKLE